MLYEKRTKRVHLDYIALAQSIVKEQISQVRPEHHDCLIVRSIGAQFKVKRIIVHYHKTGGINLRFPAQGEPHWPGKPLPAS